MTEPVVLQSAVAVATIWENKARGSGQTFWKLVTDTGDQFTVFSRDLVARFIDGQPSVQRNESLVFNFNPPVNTVVFFEAKARGKVMVPKPEGGSEPAVIPPPAAPVTTPPPAATGTPTGGQPGQGHAIGTPPVQPPYKPPYRPYAGGQKSGGGWKPEDKRPGLVTMNEAYAKDVIVAIIGNNDDLKSMSYEAVLAWAAEQTPKLSKTLLDYSLTELKALGFKLEQEK